MRTLALVQVGTTPEWVGPTVAISLAILALSFLGDGHRRRRRGVPAGGPGQEARHPGRGPPGRRRPHPQGRAQPDRAGAGRDGPGPARGRRLCPDRPPAPAQDGARRWTAIEAKLEDLETLYDVVHDEVEDTALDLAAALRSLRRGNGMLGRVRRMLVPSR